MDNTTPSLVESLIPDACGIRMDIEFARFLADVAYTFVEDTLPKIMLDEIHLVNEAEDNSRRTELLKSFDDFAISNQIAFEFAGFNVKDVDKNSDFGEDVLALGGKVALIESILSVKRNIVRS